MENDPPPPRAAGNASNPIRNNDVSSDSMVSLISGLSESVIELFAEHSSIWKITPIYNTSFVLQVMSNQFSILNGHNRQRFGGPGSVNGSEDGFGFGRIALGGRISGRMQMRPSVMNDPASGDGGDCHEKKFCTEI